MKAGKMKKVLLLILCVIISITMIYTAIFHTLPFVFIGKKLYFTQARKVVAIEGATIYDDKDMYRLSKFSNVRQLEICGKDLDPVFLENKDKLEYLYINDLALKAADLSDEKPFAKLKELDMTSDGFDMDILKDNNVIYYLYLNTIDVHNFAEIYDHTSLTKLSLTIFPNDTESLELDRLGELDRLEFVYLRINSDEQTKYDLSSFAKCDNIKRLVLSTEAESYDFLLDMDSLEELCVDDKFVSHGVFKALEEKGVKVEYME